MNARYYLIFIIVFMALTLFAVLFVNLNELNNTVYNQKGTVTNKYFDQKLSCFIVNCTGTLYEVKNGVYQKNSTFTYDNIFENQTYMFKFSFDTQNNLWNIINATSAAK
jgi:hypothetical protein